MTIGPRLDSPDEGMIARLEAQLGVGKPATAQWAGPPDDPAVFAEVNRLCAQYGARLEVRFYGWYAQRGHFDAGIVRALPDVRRLSVDCLASIDNEDAIAELPHLESLHLGVFELPDGGLLAKLPLEQLTRISLVENRKRNFDLAPLARCTKAEVVFVQGHTRGIGALSGLPRVRDLMLSGMPKKQPLAFVNAMPGLRDLHLILGSRASIDEIAHDRLEKLTITWVRSLGSIGDLARFPALRELIVEDQLQVIEIDLAGAPIERLRVSNCKKLAALRGLDALTSLEWFHASQTTLDLDSLRDRAWPATTHSVGLFSGSLKWNEATKAALAARGYTQFPDEPRLDTIS